MDEKEKQLQELEVAKAKLETDLSALDSQLQSKQGQDAGLTQAVDAKKKELADLGDKIRKTKELDQSRFEQVRDEHKQDAVKQLVAKFPELADSAKLQAVLTRFTSKDDSGKFESAAILQDLTMAYYNANPQEFLKIVQSREINDEAIRLQKEQEAAAAGGYVPPSGGDELTPLEQNMVKTQGLTPEFVKKMRGKDTISGGLLKGTEKEAV